MIFTILNTAYMSCFIARFTYHDEFGDRRVDVTSARTYFYDSEGQCDKNMWTFMKCVDVVEQATEGTGLAAIKLTALGRPQFLVCVYFVGLRYNHSHNVLFGILPDKFHHKWGMQVFSNYR